jgi:DNA-directed RNA polymerase subunit M/transcription elongation factor TFIIS
MPTLFVRCEACRAEFPTPIGEPEGGPSGVIISGLKLRCPKCGQERAYDTPDFYVPTVHDAPPSGRRDEAEENLEGEAEAQRQNAADRVTGAVVTNPEGRPPRGE